MIPGFSGAHLSGRGAVLSASLVAMAGVLGLTNLATGSYGLGLDELWSVVTGHPQEDIEWTVVVEFRLPRFFVAFLCGGMLALSGAILQVLTRNAMADPALLGVSQGAALAVVGLIVLFPQAPHGLRTPLAFLGAIMATLVVQAVAGGPKSAAPLRLVLSGIGISAFLGALISALLTHGALRDAQAALRWLSGSVNTASWDEVRALTIASVLILPVALIVTRPLLALRFGPEVAVGLGVNIRRDRNAALLLAVFSAAAATAAAGPIGFVGLLAPQMAARVARTDTGMLLINSTLMGACIVVLADLAGRSLLAPTQIPAGLFTALIGVPPFVLLLMRGGTRSQP